MKPTVRDRLRMVESALEITRGMYEIEHEMRQAAERLLAEHHGSDAVNEAQVEMCVVCAPLLRKKDLEG